jgi:hypothetical protein
VQRGRGIFEVSRAVKSSIVRGDRWKKIEKLERRNFGRFAKRKKGSS